MEIIDITKEIQGTSQEQWDFIEKLRDESICNQLYHIDSEYRFPQENYKQVLYLHMMENNTDHPIFDNNNPTANKIMNSNSCMIKFGICKNGILVRRRDDFRNHYHHRFGIGNETYIPNIFNSDYKNHRIGSIGTKLHLLVDFKDFKYRELRKKY